MDNNQNYLLSVRLRPYEYKKFQELKDEHGISQREILELITCPCDKCRNMPIVAYDKITGEPFIIPRDILTKKVR